MAWWTIPHWHGHWLYRGLLVVTRARQPQKPEEGDPSQGRCSNLFSQAMASLGVYLSNFHYYNKMPEIGYLVKKGGSFGFMVLEVKV